MLSFCDCEAVELTIIIVVNEPYPVQIMDEFVNSCIIIHYIDILGQYLFRMLLKGLVLSIH